MTISNKPLNENLNHTTEEFFPTPRAFKLYNSNSDFFLKSLREQLFENTIWMSNVKDFNDPLEMTGFIDDVSTSAITEEMNLFLEELIANPEVLTRLKHAEKILAPSGNSMEKIINIFQRSFPDIQNGDELAIALEKQGIDYQALIIKQFHESQKRMVDHARVFCTMDNLQNIAMWSYYANNHKGIGIEYLRTSPISMYSQQVTYTDKAASLTLTEQDYTSTKHLYFRHESERRYIQNTMLESQEGAFIDEGKNQFKFHDNALKNCNGHIIKSIHFGVNTSNEIKNEVIKMVKEAPYDIFITQACLSQKSYSIDFIQHR